MDVLQISKIAVSWELYQCGTPVTHISNQLSIHRSTIYRWITGIKEAGSLEVFIDLHLVAKKGERAKRVVNPLLKRTVWDLREKHNDCCGQKIEYFLKKNHGITLGTTTIYKTLSEKYQLRTRWKKNKVRGPVPMATRSREVVGTVKYLV